MMTKAFIPLALAVAASVAANGLANPHAGDDAALESSTVATYRAYISALNSHQIDRTLNFYAPGYIFRRLGQPVERTMEELRHIREWETPMQARLEAEIVSVNGEWLTARVIETNLLYEALEVHRPMVWTYRIRDGRLYEANLTEIREEARPWPRARLEFEAWLTRRPVEETEGLLSDGRLMFTGEAARRLRPFLRQWRQAVAAARVENEKVMRSFIAALNRHDVDAQYRHYSPDVTYLDNGSRVVPDKERSRPNREFEAANHAQWSYRALGAGLDSLDVIVTEEMEFYRLLGVGARSHRAYYRFREGKIFEVEAWDWTQSGRPYAATRDRFAQWVLRERPDAAAHVINGGGLQFNAATAPVINLLLREWRAAGMPGSPPEAARLPTAQSPSARGATSIPGGEK